MKKKMIKEGMLDKYGKPNENTPNNWLSDYVDYKVSKKDAVPKMDIKREADDIPQESFSPAHKKVNFLLTKLIFISF